MNIIGSKETVQNSILLTFSGNVTGIMQAAFRVGEVYTIYYWGGGVKLGMRNVPYNKKKVQNSKILVLLGNFTGTLHAALRVGRIYNNILMERERGREILLFIRRVQTDRKRVCYTIKCHHIYK